MATERAVRIPAQPAGRGPNGRKLCRWCHQEVPVSRRTFCSEACVDEALIRSSPGHARTLVERRDHGVCAAYGCNTNVLRDLLQHLDRNARGDDVPWYEIDKLRLVIGEELCRERLAVWTAAAKAAHVALVTALMAEGFDRDGYAGVILWHADHIVPVTENGGGCGLENLRTLCVPCHKAETRRMHRRLADQRRAQLPLLSRAEQETSPPVRR